MRRMVALLGVGALMMGLAACGGGDDAKVGAPPTLTASPIDVAHLTAISKFRSCSGHDFSPGVRGHGKPGAEAARSMKHYLQTDVPIDAANSLPVFAPSGGTIEIVEETYPLGKQVYIKSGGWSVRVFHIDPTVANGATVKAGDQIGTVPPANAVEVLQGKKSPNGGVPTYEFDIAVTSDDGQQYESVLTLFDKATADAWAAHGFTEDAAIITREARDAAPCELAADGENFANKNTTDPNDWVQATN